ncbi:MAG: hypothetical protein ACOX8V_03255 [Thermoleophilia bacterium]|jgi:hypothetical protein
MSADDRTVNPIFEEKYYETNAAAQAREPRRGDWGYYSYLDRPACCGGGIGGFAWFDDQQAMYTFIHDFFAWAPVVLDGPTERNEKFAPNVQALFENQALVADESRLRKAFNEAFKGEFQIEWWGPFSSLLDDGDGFPAEVRGKYWESHTHTDGDGPQHDPIPVDRLQEFVEFIRYYGI